MKKPRTLLVRMTMFTLLLFVAAFGYYSYSLNEQKVNACFAAKKAGKESSIKAMDYIPALGDIAGADSPEAQVRQDRTIVIEKDGLRVSLKLKTAKLDAVKAGLVLDLKLENRTGNELDINLLDLKIGIRRSVMENTCYPEINENSFIKVKQNTTYQKKLVYYPENDSQEKRIHLYNGDFLKDYFINIDDFLVKDGQPLLKAKVNFMADPKAYAIYKKRYARNGKYIDYHYVPDKKQQDAFVKEQIMSMEDQNGYNLLRNQTNASISIFAYKNKLNLRLKIVNGDIAMDARKIRLITPDGKKYVSENGFQEFVGKDPYARDKQTYFLLGTGRIEQVFIYNIKNAPTEITLDLSGLLYRYHDESHEEHGGEEKSDQGPFLPATIKFKSSGSKN